MLVSPFRNHSNSWTIERRCSFFVVTSGKPSRRSKRICQPNTLRVPVPVRSAFSAPCSRTWRSRSRYCFTPSTRLRSHDRLRLHRRCVARTPQAIQAERDHRQFQHLAHGQPAEGEIAELRIGYAHELDDEAETPVHQGEQGRYAI